MSAYTFGKKAAVGVIHQLFLILMVTSLFTLDYYLRGNLMENSMFFSVLAVVGLVGTFVALAYLTDASGDHPVLVDKIYSDVFVVLFIFFVWPFGRMVMGLKMQDFSLAGLLVAVGTLSYLADLVFLVFYLSIVRRIKSDILFTNSLIYRLYSFFFRLAQQNHREKPLLLTRKSREWRRIQKAIEEIAEGAFDTRLEAEEFHGLAKALAEEVNHIGAGMREAVGESIRNERMKADLITNVSHDIKTPLTSIVNYVDLLKRENLENENARNYIRILDEKSQRLKQLTEDLVDASKISSGNISLDMQRIDFVELLYQTGGEFNERFEERELTIVTKLPNEPVMVNADGRQLYRAIENLYTNAAKYALEKTRVYAELTVEDGRAVFTMKNISKNPISAQLAEGGNELTERFVRGESSRTTEGSGLGLSIAKNLTQLMGGEFDIQTDTDIFAAVVSFKIA